MAVMKAKAFQAPHNVRFRSINGTGLASEAYLIGVDFWKNGFTRIMTLPSVRLPYSLNEYIAYNGHVQPNDWKGDRTNPTQTAMEEKIDWATEPPEKVEWFPYNQYYNHPDVSLSLTRSDLADSLPAGIVVSLGLRAVGNGRCRCSEAYSG